MDDFYEKVKVGDQFYVYGSGFAYTGFVWATVQYKTSQMIRVRHPNGAIRIATREWVNKNKMQWRVRWRTKAYRKLAAIGNRTKEQLVGGMFSGG